MKIVCDELWDRFSPFFGGVGSRFPLYLALKTRLKAQLFLDVTDPEPGIRRRRSTTDLSPQNR